MGGLARRASVLKDYLRRHPQAAAVVVETGNAMKQSDNLDDPASRWVMEALNALGCHAVNVTPADLRRLNRVAEMGEVPAGLRTEYLASMAGPAPGNHFPIKPYTIRTLRPAQGNEDVRIGILAVTASPPGSTAPALSVDQALSQYLPEVDKQSDLVVLLARVPDSELRRIAGSFPAIDIIINGNPKGEGREFPKIGDTVIVESAHGGVALGFLDVEWDEKGRIKKSGNQLIPLPPMIPDDPEMARIAEKAHGESIDFMEEKARRSPPVLTPSIFGGAGACKDCHEGAFKTWEKSAHAHAIDSLKKTRDHFNDKCLICHVTGFGEKRGFHNILRTPELANVQCEACHTPSRQHSQNPQAYHPGSEIGINHRRKVRQDFCLRCHTEENSPRFNYEEYWKKIAH